MLTTRTSHEMSMPHPFGISLRKAREAGLSWHMRAAETASSPTPNKTGLSYCAIAGNPLQNLRTTRFILHGHEWSLGDDFRRLPVAPLWHTFILIAVIVLLSVAGAEEFSGPQPVGQSHANLCDDRRHGTLHAGVGLFRFAVEESSFPIVASVPFPEIFDRSHIDFGLALGFWIGSLFTLATIGIFWTLIEAAIKHRPLLFPGKPLTPDASQQQTLHTLTHLAPTNGSEVAAWIFLCIHGRHSGRGGVSRLFHRQFTAWARGAVAVGVVVSALLFGAAHGYQGARNMVLLTIFGVLFSVLALFRGSLRPGNSRAYLAGSLRGFIARIPAKRITSSDRVARSAMRDAMREEKIVATFSTSMSFFS